MHFLVLVNAGKLRKLVGTWSDSFILLFESDGFLDPDSICVLKQAWRLDLRIYQVHFVLLFGQLSLNLCLQQRGLLRLKNLLLSL